ncbi:PTS sugar transporter subunit IIA [Shimazuella kribbensis]|uniref:PTS sugar transporter subunit IIA n=1 Tax=Shimazuella kribbensis TaxID=139808 RepID=UPI000424CA9C|nr:PTS glucose transporter subunit IIA [Shimazuella kribbensis]
MFSKWFSSNKLSLASPMTGTLVTLDQVPDPVFSQKMTGDGLAIEPKIGRVVAPFDGKIIHLFETKHAIILENQNQIQVLIHIGLDTVKLNGEGFTSHVKIGDEVKTNDMLIEFDMEKIQHAGYSTISPVVITNGEIVKEQKILETGLVEAGKTQILSIVLK